MRRIFVSDIFGRTPALEKLCTAVGSSFDVIDPYAGKYMDFQDEQAAYEFFMANVGLNAYSEIVQSRLDNTAIPIHLIGFSVGASAIWRISETLSTEKIKRMVCFYGSQTRYFTEIKPRVAVEHILPTHEPGFSIDELASRLSGKENVMVHKSPYLHGFMNELSKNYSTFGCTRYVDRLREQRETLISDSSLRHHALSASI